MSQVNTSLYPGLQLNLQGIPLAAAVASVSLHSQWQFHKMATTGSNAGTFQPYDGEKEIYSLEGAERIVLDGNDENDGNLNLQGKVCLLPSHCVLQIKNGGRFYNGTLISQETIIVGDDGTSLPSMPTPRAIKGYKNIEMVVPPSSNPDLDIVGKIYDAQGREITIRGGIIDRGTPLRHTYTGAMSFSGDQYDDCGISNLGRRARNLGLTDCIFGLNVRRKLTIGNNSELNSLISRGYSSTSGPYPLVCGSQGYPGEEFCYTPYDLAHEMLANGLCVKALKFYSKSYVGTLDDYCAMVYNFTRDLLAQMRLLGLSLPTEFDISNEMAVWTYAGPENAQTLADLAIRLSTSLANDVYNLLINSTYNPGHYTENYSDVSSLTMQPGVSFAGMAQLSQANPLLYNHVEPLLNIYPTLSFDDATVDRPLDNEATRQEMARVMCESFHPHGTFWHGRQETMLAICETGVRPYRRALRYPEHYDLTDSYQPVGGTPIPYLGEFSLNVLPLYWAAMEQAALRNSFRYINVFYAEEFYDNNSTEHNNIPGDPPEMSRNANIEVPMHDFFLTFANPIIVQTLEIPEAMTIYKPQNSVGVVKYFRITRPCDIYLNVFACGRERHNTSRNSVGTTQDYETVDMWTAKNGYSLHYGGAALASTQDYSPDLEDWFFDTDTEPFELLIFLAYDPEDECLYLCADSQKVERIDITSLKQGQTLCIDELNNATYPELIIDPDDTVNQLSPKRS